MHSESYLKLLEEMADLHKRKSAGYAGSDPDPWRNFRKSEKFGVPAWKGALIRMSDKWSRIESLLESSSHEQVGETLEDTLMDLSAYALIVLCLLRETYDAPNTGETTKLNPNDVPPFVDLSVTSSGYKMTYGGHHDVLNTPGSYSERFRPGIVGSGNMPIYRHIVIDSEKP